MTTEINLVQITCLFLLGFALFFGGFTLFYSHKKALSEGGFHGNNWKLRRMVEGTAVIMFASMFISIIGLTLVWIFGSVLYVAIWGGG